VNCQLFEDLLIDLAREGAVEESVRLQALAHADSCSRCSARLANEQSLSAVIKLARAEGGEAPVRIETALISAYRRRGENTAPEAATRTVPRIVPSRYWGIAAALLVALLGVATFRLLRALRPEQTKVEVSTQGASSQKISRPAAMEATPGRTVPASEPAPLTARSEPVVKKAAPRLPAAKTAPADTEVATEFFPLTSSSELSTMESGQLVRVLLPRNAMASYGLPVNQERIDQPVTAQVLIGQDGVARAIRFLSQQSPNYVQTGTRSKR
jgi:hypothetical protein